MSKRTAGYDPDAMFNQCSWCRTRDHTVLSEGGLCDDCQRKLESSGHRIPSHRSEIDDDSPWRENAVRALEEGTEPNGGTEP